MSEEYVLLRDIVYGHNERILNLKKYYPYFKIAENSFLAYKEGKYADLDMGYIMMAVLRFFIEENNFKEKDVTYDEYEIFLNVVLRRDFGLHLEEEESKQLCGYIFDKLTNDGHPFTYDYFDPQEKKKKTVRTRMIESKMKQEQLVYNLSSDAVAFYLETKEMKEESSITVAQVLLGKMISTQNFKGGIQVVKRINNEVSRLKLQKDEVLTMLSHDVFEGAKAYEEFVQTGMQWFEEEQKLFAKNKDLIEKALGKMEQNPQLMENDNFMEIYQLEDEMKRAIARHSELLHTCTDLQYKVDEMIRGAKYSKLRSSFDFQNVYRQMVEQDNPKLLQLFVEPLLKLNMKKTFSMMQLDSMLTVRSQDGEKGEKIKEQIEEDYLYPDEVEEERIQHNSDGLIRLLFEYGMEQKAFSLQQWNEYLQEKCGDNVLDNGDYYSLLVHMCQKKNYPIKKILKKPDTFFEKQICHMMEQGDNREMYEKYILQVEPDASVQLQLGNGLFTISDIHFELMEER